MEGRSNSNRYRQWIVSNCLVHLPELECLVPPLRHLTDDATGLPCNNAEARYDHVGGYDGTVEDADVVLDDGKLADDDGLADMDMAPDRGCLYNSAFADENVIA